MSLSLTGQGFKELMRGPTGHDERLVPETADPGNLAHHLKRYHFALPYCDGKTVVDLGAGVGYGARIIAPASTRTYGIDYDPTVVSHAKAQYGCADLHFVVGDATCLPVKSRSVDVVVCFEVIEHVARHEALLVEACRVLKEDGVFLVSTPNAATVALFRRTFAVSNPAHVSEVDLNVFREELRRHFSEVRLFGMRMKGNSLYTGLRALDVCNLRLRMFGSRRLDIVRTVVFEVPKDPVSVDDVVVSRRQLRQANGFLAVCRRKCPGQ